MKKIAPFLMLFIMSLSAYASPKNERHMSCAGTEPFWGVLIQGNVISYDDPNLETPIKYWDARIEGAIGAPAHAFQIKASRLHGKEKIELYITHTDCNDGMSDEIYPYQVILNQNDIIEYGCCGDL